MSDDDLYLMNSKESSVLTSNLLTSESSELQLEIIGDSANLRALGNLCESMVSSVFCAGARIGPILNHSFWVVSTSADAQSFYGPVFYRVGTCTDVYLATRGQSACGLWFLVCNIKAVANYRAILSSTVYIACCRNGYGIGVMINRM